MRPVFRNPSERFARKELSTSGKEHYVIYYFYEQNLTKRRFNLSKPFHLSNTKHEAEFFCTNTRFFISQPSLNPACLSLVNPFHACKAQGNFTSGTVRIRQHVVDRVMLVNRRRPSLLQSRLRNIGNIANGQIHTNLSDDRSRVPGTTVRKPHTAAVA